MIWRKFTIFLLVAAAAVPAFATRGIAADVASVEARKIDAERDVKERLGSLLRDFCRDACTLIDVRADVEDAAAQSDDLGFEGMESNNRPAVVTHLAVDLEIDDRVSSVNRERLATVLKNHLSGVAPAVDVRFKAVTMPQIGQSAALEEELKHQLEERVTDAVERVFQNYCPEGCVLASLDVRGKLITPDEAQNLPSDRQVKDRGGNAILKIEGVDLSVALDQALDADTRNRIAGILKAKTRFASPMKIELETTAFPESAAKKDERLKAATKDPFGLAPLRETLKLFRELGSTKEIVTNNLREQAEAGREPTPWWQYALGGVGVFAALILITVVALRFAAASRDTRGMMQAASGAEGRMPWTAAPAASRPQEGKDGQSLPETARSDVGVRLASSELKDELVRGFMESPRVAKETFSRLLQEEGIEETARYVHIFGHLVIFELLNDPNLQRDLYELSEYYHKSEFEFTPPEELKLLTALKTRVTANEIRVMTRRQTDKFDFLTRLDATQIYNLVGEEKAQVQSIVLTQLDPKRRRAVFDMYRGDAKVDLMRELCRADAIPKEYLSNVAKALQRKVAARPEFDTEHLRSSDILLDLLEKAELSEQRALMKNLTETNRDAARGIKLKLVTVEILPYLKDGHLLEIMLGMEREDLVLFLTGTRDHIRNLVLSKAPEELAESWVEDLTNAKSFDEQSYRLVEMKILGRIRSLANNGVINLLDVNELVFGAAEEEASAELTQGVAGEGAAA